MLEMRLLRSGRRNQASFRVVLTEKSKPPKSGFIKILGWYNPHSKETSLKKDDILYYLEKGAKPSNSLAKILISEGIKHKNILYVPNAKKEAKSKDGKKVEEQMANPKEPDKQDADQADKQINESVEQKEENIPEQPEQKEIETEEK